MKIRNSPQLRAWLVRHAHTAVHIPTSEFHFDDELFAEMRAQVAAHHPGMSDAGIDVRAAFLLLREGHCSKPLATEVKSGGWTHWLRDVWTSLSRKPVDEIVWRIAVLLLLLIIACALVAKAEPEPTNAAYNDYLHALIIRPGILAQGNAGGFNARAMYWNGTSWVAVASGTPFPVTCVSGCSAAGAFTDNSAFTVGTTSVSNIGAYFTSGADPTLSTGNAGRVRMDSHSYLFVDCVVGCAGGSTTPADAFANPTTAGLQFDLLAGFNGTTWDRLRVDASKNLQVSVNAALPAGTNVIGAVTANAGTNLNTSALMLDASKCTAASGGAPPANGCYAEGLGSGATGGDLIGIPVSDTPKTLDITTATTTLFIAGVAGRKIRIGSLIMMAAGADNVELIEGTTVTTPCDTGTAGMFGGTTSGTGFPLLANQGETFGSGLGTVFQTATAGDNVCIVTSAAVNLAVTGMYAIY